MKVRKKKRIVIALILAAVISLLLATYFVRKNTQNVDRGNCSTVQGDGFIGSKSQLIEVCP